MQYLTRGRAFSCSVCGKEETGNVYCPGGHYVCEECHGKGSFDVVLNLALSSKSADPLAIAEEIMEIAPIPMLGCEHAWVTAAALMAAIKNHGQIKITNEQITEAMRRTQRQAIGAFCGLTGVCGVAIGVGATFSVILDAACPKDRETASTMHVVSRVIEAIANETGPCCCKNFVRKALTVSSQLAGEYLQISLPHSVEPVCRNGHRHPHGCRQDKCSYYPGLKNVDG
ncbi:MAG TPA: hypothetical protein GXX25_14965 [Desulfotomaculum sp.]|nr:hypothetical protein [Desulfotomaculum sp.]